MSGSDHAYSGSIHQQPKRLFGARRVGGGATKGSQESPVVHRRRARRLFGALRLETTSQ